MRKTLIIVLAALFNITVIGQTVNTVKLSDSLLKPGKLKATITTYDFPNDVKILQDKTLKTLKANPEWADKYIVLQVQKGSIDIPKLLEAYGLTEAEFNTMLEGFKKRKQPIFSDTTDFIIKKVNGLITFQTSRQLTLFNHLSIDTKRNTILFDNLTPTKELQINGKFYAPILNGFETHTSQRASSAKSVTGISSFGLSVGVNKGDNRPTMTLIYGKGQVGDSKILSVTLL